MLVEVDGHLTRDALTRLSILLGEEPAVLVTGPRGSGKSTLLREIAISAQAVHLDLDDERVLNAVQQDPSAALSHPRLVVLDEFQRAPAALSVVKRLVDRHPIPGRFLLAGSISAPLLPTGSETLTGRVHRLNLSPLSAAELLSGSGRLLPGLLTADKPPMVLSQLARADYFALIAAGGYPAALSRKSTTSRSRWHNSYLDSVAERDLPDLVPIRHPGALARLYRKIAQETSTIQVRSKLGEDLGLSAITARSYFDLLQHVFLVSELPGWTIGVSAKPGRRPKVHVTDTGLAASALGLSANQLATRPLGGMFLESFVFGELIKQSSIIDEPLRFAHFRDRSGIEVDIIIERPDGRIIAIEVKSATTTSHTDGKGLRFLAERLKDRFQAGLIMHTGPLTSKVADRIWATPVGALWELPDRSPLVTEEF